MRRSLVVRAEKVRDEPIVWTRLCADIWAVASSIAFDGSHGGAIKPRVLNIVAKAVKCGDD